MKCPDCKNYIGGICMLAQEGKISEIDDSVCLLRCQISLLRSIWEELVFQNEDRENGEEWKI
jgi:hypothetical protein